MKTIAKIQFLRTDIFDQFFNGDHYFLNNLNLVHSIGDNWLALKDHVINNDESTARLNILNHVKDNIGTSDLIEGKEPQIKYDIDFQPVSLNVDLENSDDIIICRIIEISQTEEE
ncbi:hypothetical protein SAMN03080617_01842 [Algoriphagus alkaliphilus]|uniref:Uncharacterized protein n=1 Tax=Algoriphagus alkaliphilus TaxID=279824 RepID=A0A1G5XKM5_9BACT|nr:hypothetical protein [Algoriphagus alkaliphilus]MBA4302398.1 hypothetical protein [Cyclobacterium sp.]SDA71029.1 hypothetical protein SAMN03080617_01842 [Algoriphagus alkaliphilus]